MSADDWVPLLRGVLQAAAKPYSRGVNSKAAFDGKGIGGAWALLAEISRRPDFPSELRRLVAATYPRQPNCRSGLDQLLQRLLLERPPLAACVVRPLMQRHMRPGEAAGGDPAAAAATTGGGAADRSGASMGGDAQAGSNAGTVEQAGKAAGLGGGVGGAGRRVREVEEEGEADQRAGPLEEGAAGAGAGVEEAEEEAPTGKGRPLGVARGEGARTGRPETVAAAAVYDRRQLPVSWLLRCFGEVSEPLRCLWPPERQQELRAHVLAAAAVSFAEHHYGSGGEGRRVSYIPGSPVVQFVRDCFAATPPCARMGLLEDAMRLTAQSALQPPPHHQGNADGAAAGAVAPSAGAEVQVEVEVEVVQVGTTADDGDDEGGQSRPEGPSVKRRRLLEPEPPPAAAQIAFPPSSAPLPQLAPAALRDAGEAAMVTEGQRRVPAPRNGGDPWVVRGQGGAVPWAALLAHVCEEEEAAVEAAVREPTDPRVMSPRAMCELLLARGDLFGPADIAAAAPSLLCFLASLEPSQSAQLLAAVLACPASADTTSPPLLLPPLLPPPTLPEAVPGCWASHVAGIAAAAAGGGGGGGLAAALAVLRRPSRLRAVAVLLPVRAVAVAGQQKQPQRGKKRGRGQGGKAAAELVPLPAPPSLTALWLLSHVVPVLLRPLALAEREAEGEQGAAQRLEGQGGEEPGAGNGISNGGRGGSGGGGADSMDGDGSGARALACLAALLRTPQLLLPDQPQEDPEGEGEGEVLPVAARVLALQIRQLGGSATGNGSGPGPVQRLGGGGGAGGSGGEEAGGGAAQRRLAALLCGAFGVVAPTGGAGGGGGLGNAAASWGSLRAVAEELIGATRARAEAGGEAGALGAPPAWTEAGPCAAASGRGGTHGSFPSRPPAQTAQPAIRLWPAIRPLLALLDHLPYGNPVVTAVHAVLLTALLQRSLQIEVAGGGDGGGGPPTDGSRRAAPDCPNGPSAGAGCWTREGESLARGFEEAGAAAASEILDLLVVEAATAGGGGGGGVDGGGGGCAASTTWQSAVRLSAAAKLDVLRVVSLAADVTYRRGGCGAAASDAAAAAAGEGVTESGTQGADVDAAAAAAAGSSWAATRAVGGSPGLSPMVTTVSERLGRSVAEVAQALLAHQNPAAAAAPGSTTATAAALARLTPQALLARLAAGVVAAGREEAAGAAARPLPQGCAAGAPPTAARDPLPEERLSSDDGGGAGDGGGGDTAAECLVRLLRRCTAAAAALRPFSPEPFGSSAAGSGATSLPGTSAGIGVAAFGAGGGGGGGGVASRAGGALQGTLSVGLDHRVAGPQLVQQTQQALRLLAAAVYGG
ncbi:hypothetical protein PLESTM_000767800 [Pleodorina starrii]|nr:hypothetical protein PLESTM_000767800 [Pleodorina starrii]